ncbi:MAG: hypothetical protein FWG65_12065, partial [Turicibacter sp.]|nr:hypothetical protein [Turicibacter sp.]
MNTATSFSTTRPPTGWHTNNITISQNKPEDTSVGDFPDPSKPIIGTDPTPGNNLTTTNDVFNMIRGLGNFSVIVGELHPSRNHPSHTVSGRELLNYAN